MNIIAEITRDAIPYDRETQKGRLFEYTAFLEYWARANFGGFDVPQGFLTELVEEPRTNFRMYDDDGELYYEGWLKDDGECLVQQWVLAWGMYFAGCTVIKVQQSGKWVQVIG